MTDPGPLKRTLHPPSHSEPQASPGDDVIAVKRAISRAGFWPWDPPFSDDYTNDFAHGGDSQATGGVAAFQRSVGLDGTGTYGKNTHEKLRNKNVPSGKPNAGEDCFDKTAADLYKGYGDSGGANVERVQKLIVEFCEKGLDHPGGWHYTQNRAVDVSVDPTGTVYSDCSGSVIQAYNYAKRKSGLAVPDPAKQGWSGYGNTGSYEDDHPSVSGSYRVGDLAHYNGHVCLCIKAGNWDTSRWWSFGSEPPSRRELGYRSDFRKVVRPPLVN